MNVIMPTPGAPENIINISDIKRSDNTMDRLNKLKHLLALVPKSDAEAKERDGEVASLRRDIDAIRERNIKRMH